eukprot:6857296-Alexandrium_andersonii.AAC.1
MSQAPCGGSYATKENFLSRVSYITEDVIKHRVAVGSLSSLPLAFQVIDGLPSPRYSANGQVRGHPVDSARRSAARPARVADGVVEVPTEPIWGRQRLPLEGLDDRPTQARKRTPT